MTNEPDYSLEPENLVFCQFLVLKHPGSICVQTCRARQPCVAGAVNQVQVQNTWSSTCHHDQRLRSSFHKVTVPSARNSIVLPPTMIVCCSQHQPRLGAWKRSDGSLGMAGHAAGGTGLQDKNLKQQTAVTHIAWLNAQL